MESDKMVKKSDPVISSRKCDVMNRLDRLYQKALIIAKNKRRQSLLEKSEKFMGLWVDFMRYCRDNRISVPEDQEALKTVYRKIFPQCGYSEDIEEYLSWYFDRDNDSIFITIDYGGGEIEYGYPA